ncbi:MAG: serine hydrolase domain-containing protein, partial [Bacteroidota bacterium]
MRKYLMIFISVLAFSCNENASSFTDTERDKTLSYLEQTMDQEGIPGLQIAVIKGNEVLLSESLGLANVPFKVDVQAHTIFPICSISKIFAATAILQLEEQNKLVLSDAISEYLPNLPEQWRSVRIEQLLSHTSGLPDIEDPNEDQLIGGKSEDAAWTAVQKMPIQFEPGEDFSYNATNFLLIQQLIEQLG